MLGRFRHPGKGSAKPKRERFRNDLVFDPDFRFGSDREIPLVSICRSKWTNKSACVNGSVDDILRYRSFIGVNPDHSLESCEGVRIRAVRYALIRALQFVRFQPNGDLL